MYFVHVFYFIRFGGRKIKSKLRERKPPPRSADLLSPNPNTITIILSKRLLEFVQTIYMLELL